MNTNLFSPVLRQTRIEGSLVGATRRVARGQANLRTSRRLVPTAASALHPSFAANNSGVSSDSSLIPPPSSLLTSAFTLIEVCIAVAVAGFVLVALLAVLGDSMAHGRRASDQTKATLIQQRIMRDLRSQPFGSSINIPSDGAGQTVSLTTSNARTWYFGREAQYLGITATADRYFQADLVAVPVTNLTGLTRIALSVSWIAGQPRMTTNTLHTWVGQRE
jgi:uncharacterized protein (TIGR02598 family)